MNETTPRQHPQVLAYRAPTPPSGPWHTIVTQLKRYALALLAIAWTMAIGGTLYVAALIAYVYSPMV